MSRKTKRRRFSFKENYELIKEVKAGAPKEFTLNKYCITDRMYNRVIDSDSKVIVNVRSYEFKKTKSSKTSANTYLDAAVLTWFKQARDIGDPISGPIIQEKARILNEKLGSLPTYNIRELKKEDCNMYEHNSHRSCLFGRYRLKQS